MKVEDVKRVAAAQAQAKAEARERTAPAERVSTQNAQRLEALVRSVQSQAPASRSARVQELAAAVKSGRYHVNPHQLAEQIVSAAELEARLRAMLDK